MAPRFRIRDILLTGRPVRFTHPFRFGAATVEGAPEIVVHAQVELEDGRKALGAAAELMVPKWFNKDPKLTPDQTVDQLRRALDLARKAYLARGAADTAFGHHAAHYGAHIAACDAEGIPALAAAFGPAEIDKAILDALLRALGLDVLSGLRTNAVGLDARLTPDLDGSAIGAFLASRKVPPRIMVRHTVGMMDAVEDLADIHRQTGCRYFKLKMSGDPAADRDRLAAIVGVLDGLGIDYRFTLDANEQYPSHDALTKLVETVLHDRAFEQAAQRLLYIEQPLPRELTWTLPLGEAARSVAFIVDEADASYDAFPRALALGYRGISSKCCKGLYKSLLNGARAMQWHAKGEARAFVAAEDLTCQAGLAVQQDTALIAFHGLAHAERNGHHYGDGFAAAGAAEGQAFLAAHPDLYEIAGGKIRLAIRDGAIATGSLSQPGFASGVDPALVGQTDIENEEQRKYAS
jgi:hypothetical protein